jgi:hypothetical protein
MQTQTLLGLAFLATANAYAGQPCEPEYLSTEDVSIMASVMISPDAVRETRFVDNGRATILYSVRDAYGRVGPEDLSQMQSVQPQGGKVVYCLNTRSAVK